MFYIRAPSGRVPLHVLEKCVMVRLEYLQLLHEGRAHEFNDNFEYLLDSSVYDKIGHFTLRLLASTSKDLCDYWFTREKLFFRTRLNHILPRQLYRLLRSILRQLQPFLDKEKLIHKTLTNLCNFFLKSSVFKHLVSTCNDNCELFETTEMSESDLLASDHIDGLDGLENGQDGDAIMQCDGVKRELNEANIDDPELEAIKARVREMEEEAEKLKQLQSEVDKQMNMGSPPGITSPLNMSLEDKREVDNRSIYVGNVDYGATAEELEQHFHGCGSVNRVTILCNKFDGHPKGFAYIEFAERDSVQTAMAMDESMFRGRQIKVMPKRTNRPGLSVTNRGPRGTRGYRGVARGIIRGSAYFGYRPTRRPRSYKRGYYMPY